MSMSPRLLRPRQTGHPDAVAWKAAVAANGGTVSSTTYAAVEKFCKTIDASGLRSRFYRLNLFCGDYLAALVPLYRSPSAAGTKFGSATDSANNFVSSDYNETGASGGLAGNGSNKHLGTGFPMNTLPSVNSGHVAVYNRNRSSSNVFRGVGGVLVAGASGFGIALDNGVYSMWGNLVRTVDSANGLLVSTRTSSTLNAVFSAGSQIGSNTNAATPSASAVEATFFCERVDASTVRYFDSGRYQSYSIGTGLTAAEVTSYNAALVAFHTALSRN